MSVESNPLIDRSDVWDRFVNNASETFSRQELEWLKPMFFETEFEYGNDSKYGVFAKDYLKAFKFCPAQNVEVWNDWFSNKLPLWLEDDYERKLPAILRELGQGQGFQVENYGWPFELTVDLFYFCYGKKITTVSFDFLDSRLDVHPLLRPNIVEFHRTSISNILRWFNGSNHTAGLFHARLVSFWLSIFNWLPPAFFDLKLYVGAQKQQCLLQDLFITLRDRENLKLDAERNEFVELFIDGVTSNRVPRECRDLWFASQDPDFIHSRDVESLSRPDGYMKLNASKISMWITTNIQKKYEDEQSKIIDT